MISENLITIIFNYLEFNEYVRSIDVSSYNMDYSNSIISFTNYQLLLSSAIGIHLTSFKFDYLEYLSRIQFLNIINVFFAYL